jgi:thiol:disulfide interchange protein DsbA
MHSSSQENRMKRMLFISIIVGFALAACTSEEPAATAPEPIVEQQAEPEAEADVAETETDEEVQPELVEESAAEPDEEQEKDQPIILAPDDESTSDAITPREWQFSEGQHYHRLVPTQPTVGGADKIEVAEVFWYGCPHCYSFEPQINKWAQNIPPNARFVRIPAVWNPLARLHGRLYYTEEVLARNGKLADADGFHAAVFNEFHRKSNRLTSEDSIQKLFERFGVNRDDFFSTWNSFEVNQKVRVADDLVRRYNVTGVPAIVVNGKYRTGAGPNEAGSTTNLLKVIDELIARETIR